MGVVQQWRTEVPAATPDLETFRAHVEWVRDRLNEVLAWADSSAEGKQEYLESHWAILREAQWHLLVLPPSPTVPPPPQMPPVAPWTQISRPGIDWNAPVGP